MTNDKIQISKKLDWEWAGASPAPTMWKSGNVGAGLAPALMCFGI